MTQKYIKYRGQVCAVSRYYNGLYWFIYQGSTRCEPAANVEEVDDE